MASSPSFACNDEQMVGKCASNRINAIVPRAEATAPRFEEGVLLIMLALAGPSPVQGKYVSLPAGSSLSTLRVLHSGPTPLPVSDFRHVFAVLVDVLLVLDKLVLELLLQVDASVAGLWQAVDGVHHEMEAVQIVQYRHVEGRRDSALFLVTADVDVVVVRATVGQPVNQPRIGMEGEDDRLVLGEE